MSNTLQVGHLVRRTGAQLNTENTGVIVEAHTHPSTTTAQFKVYWQVTGLVEQLLSTEVEGAYPGGNAYRVGAFPLFALETGGFGDITVVTPDGERAVHLYGHDLPGYDTVHDHHQDDSQFRLLVNAAVEQYMNHLAETPTDAATSAPTLSRAVSDGAAQSCAFHTHNPVTGNLAQCMSAAEATVVVPATALGGTFKGDGVQAAVCGTHGKKLADLYGAIPDPQLARN